MWQIENEINTSFKKIFSKPRKKQKSIQKTTKQFLNASSASDLNFLNRED